MITSTLNRILYVEDEPDIQAIAKIALESIGGFTVEACSSGQQAISVAESFRPDLILLDVMMPDMDGPSTLQALRKIQQTATTPVIFMTAKVQSQEITSYKKMGAIDIIPKPFDPMTLSQTINTLWNKNHG
jgi:two-component system, OmpR family, response regulator